MEELAERVQFCSFPYTSNPGEFLQRVAGCVRALGGALVTGFVVPQNEIRWEQQETLTGGSQDYSIFRREATLSGEGGSALEIV